MRCRMPVMKKIRSSPCALPFPRPHSKKDLACLLQCTGCSAKRSVHPTHNRYLGPAEPQATAHTGLGSGQRREPQRGSRENRGSWPRRTASGQRPRLRQPAWSTYGKQALEPFDPSGEAGAAEAEAAGNSVAVGIAARPPARAAETPMRVSLPEARAPLSCAPWRTVLVFVLDACSRCQVFLALALCCAGVLLLYVQEEILRLVIDNCMTVPCVLCPPRCCCLLTAGQ